MTYPITPISIEIIEKETHIAQMIFGFSSRAMITIITAVSMTAWIVCGRMAKYWSMKMKNG